MSSVCVRVGGCGGAQLSHSVVHCLYVCVGVCTKVAPLLAGVKSDIIQAKSHKVKNYMLERLN